MKIVLAIFLLPMFRHPFGFENLHLKSDFTWIWIHSTRTDVKYATISATISDLSTHGSVYFQIDLRIYRLP